MSPKRYLVDTNILLRFLSGEPAAQAAAARRLFDRASAGEVVLDVSPVIVAETLYTLLSFYGVQGRVATEKLSHLLRQHAFGLRDGFPSAAALGSCPRAPLACKMSETPVPAFPPAESGKLGENPRNRQAEKTSPAAGHETSPLSMEAWHLQAAINATRSVHVMPPVSNGRARPQSDWVYMGSRVNATARSVAVFGPTGR